MRLLPHTAPTDSQKRLPPSLTLRTGSPRSPSLSESCSPSALSGRKYPTSELASGKHLRTFFRSDLSDRCSPLYGAHAVPGCARKLCRFRTASRNGKAASFRPSRTASLLPAGRTRPNGIAVPPGSVTSNRGNKRFYVFDLFFPTVCPRKHLVFPSTLSLYHTFFQNAIGLWKNIQLIADILLMFFR